MCVCIVVYVCVHCDMCIHLWYYLCMCGYMRCVYVWVHAVCVYVWVHVVCVYVL